MQICLSVTNDKKQLRSVSDCVIVSTAAVYNHLRRTMPLPNGFYKATTKNVFENGCTFIVTSLDLRAG